MKSVLCIALAVLAALHGTRVTAAPIPDADAQRTSIGYEVLGADHALVLGGPATPVNPHDRGCTVGKPCIRDNSKRSVLSKILQPM